MLAQARSHAIHRRAYARFIERRDACCQVKRIESRAGNVPKPKNRKRRIKSANEGAVGERSEVEAYLILRRELVSRQIISTHVQGIRRPASRILHPDGWQDETSSHSRPSLCLVANTGSVTSSLTRSKVAMTRSPTRTCSGAIPTTVLSIVGPSSSLTSATT